MQRNLIAGTLLKLFAQTLTQKWGHYDIMERNYEKQKDFLNKSRVQAIGLLLIFTSYWIIKPSFSNTATIENNIKLLPKLNLLCNSNLCENGCPHTVRGFLQNCANLSRIYDIM